MFQKELGPLKARRQLLANGPLDDAWSREANQCVWLNHIDVTQERGASGHTACCRVQADTDERLAHFAKTPQRGHGLRHLHQAEDALLHPGPSRRME